MCIIKSGPTSFFLTVRRCYIFACIATDDLCIESQVQSQSLGGGLCSPEIDICLCFDGGCSEININIWYPIWNWCAASGSSAERIVRLFGDKAIGIQSLLLPVERWAAPNSISGKKSSSRAASSAEVLWSHRFPRLQAWLGDYCHEFCWRGEGDFLCNQHNFCSFLQLLQFLFSRFMQLRRVLQCYFWRAMFWSSVCWKRLNMQPTNLFSSLTRGHSICQVQNMCDEHKSNYL